MLSRGARSAQSVLAGGRWLAALAVVILLVMLPGAPQASAAGLGKPVITFSSPSEGATLTTSSAQVAFTYNRTPKQTRTATCALSGPTASSGACNVPVAAAGGSSSGASYNGLANGAYMFTVTVTLTDGGTFSATRDFTVTVPAAAVLTVTNAGVSCSRTCWGFVSGSGLAPNAEVDVYASSQLGLNDHVETYAADANGNLPSTSPELLCGFGWSDLYAVSTTAAGTTITSNMVNSPCD